MNQQTLDAAVAKFKTDSAVAGANHASLNTAFRAVIQTAKNAGLNTAPAQLAVDAQPGA